MTAVGDYIGDEHFLTAVRRRPLRIVLVNFHRDPDERGAEALLASRPALTETAEALVRAGVELTVVQAAHVTERVEHNGMSYRFVIDGGRSRRRIARAIAALAPDVVHVNGFHNGLAVRTLGRTVPSAAMLIQDHGSSPPQGLRLAAWRWAFRDVAGAVFTAMDQATPFIESGVLARGAPIFSVVGGSSSFTPGDRAQARRRTGLSGDPCFLWTGRLDRNKDPHTMLDAVELAATARPELRLWCLFGQAPLLDSVRDRIERSLTLSRCVVLVGPRPHEELESYFRAADFYLQTSHREASGFSLLEALSCGTTPLVTDIPAARRILGVVGSLTPVGDAHALASAMIDWSHRDLDGLRASARARFVDALTYDAVARDLVRAYEAVARHRSICKRSYADARP